MRRAMRSGGGDGDLRAKPSPAAAGAVNGDRAVEGGEAVAEAAQAGAAARVGASDPVVDDLDHDVGAGAPDRDRGARGVRVLGDVGERLGRDEVRGALYRA